MLAIVTCRCRWGSPGSPARIGRALWCSTDHASRPSVATRPGSPSLLPTPYPAHRSNWRKVSRLASCIRSRSSCSPSVSMSPCRTLSLLGRSRTRSQPRTRSSTRRSLSSHAVASSSSSYTPARSRPAARASLCRVTTCIRCASPNRLTLRRCAWKTRSCLGLPSNTSADVIPCSSAVRSIASTSRAVVSRAFSSARTEVREVTSRAPVSGWQPAIMRRAAALPSSSKAAPSSSPRASRPLPIQTRAAPPSGRSR